MQSSTSERASSAESTANYSPALLTCLLPFASFCVFCISYFVFRIDLFNSCSPHSFSAKIRSILLHFSPTATAEKSEKRVNGREFNVRVRSKICQKSIGERRHRLHAPHRYMPLRSCAFRGVFCRSVIDPVYVTQSDGILGKSKGEGVFN